MFKTTKIVSINSLNNGDINMSNFEFLFQQKEEPNYWIQFFKDDGPCEVKGWVEPFGLPTFNERELVECRNTHFPNHDVVLYANSRYYTVPNPHEPYDKSVKIITITTKPETAGMSNLGLD